MAAATTIIAGASATIAGYQAVTGAMDRSAAKRLREQQAQDILGQLDAEELIYEDELDMIRKQAQLAESKLSLQSSQEIEGIGEKVSEIYAQVESGDKYGGGATKKTISKLEGKYDEGLSDLKESYDMSMDELALRNEQAERDAFLRHEEIMGSLEAQFEELTA